MRYRVSCGVIPIFVEPDGTIRFLLVQGHGDYWGFPKGHKEKGETDLETAQRELFEETRTTCHTYFDEPRFSEKYRIRKRRGTDIIKKVIYYIGLVDSQRVTRQTTELKQHGWFRLEDAKEKLLDNRRDIIQQAYDVISMKNNT